MAEERAQCPVLRGFCTRHKHLHVVSTAFSNSIFIAAIRDSNTLTHSTDVIIVPQGRNTAEHSVACAWPLCRAPKAINQTGC